MGQFPLEQWFYEMPVCTRWWTVATVATSLLVQCHIITPFQLFYSFRAVFVKNQVPDVALFSPLEEYDLLNLSNSPSTGGSSPHSSISAPSPSTSSSMSSFCNAIRASSRNHLAGLPRVSLGYYSTPPRSCCVSRPYFPSLSWALPSAAAWSTSGRAATPRLA